MLASWNTFALRPAAVCVIALAGFAASMPALALVDDPEPGALRGPEVKDRVVPGVDGRFTSGKDPNRRAYGDRIPPNVFRRAMDVILAPDAPSDLRLDDAKREEFIGLVQSFEKETRAYQTAHRDEIRTLREQAGGRGKGKGDAGNGENAKPSSGESMMSEGESANQIAARERLREIQEGAPKAEDVYTKIWAQLNPAQQQAVDGALNEFRAQQSKARQEGYVQRRLNQRNPGVAGAPPRRPEDAGAGPTPRGPGAGRRPGEAPEGRGVSPERRDRLMQLFGRLNPDQQEELLRRIEDRINQEIGGPQDAPPQPRRRPGRGTERLGDMPPPPAPGAPDEPMAPRP